MELHVVERLPDDRTGMIMTVHHALLDGPSGAELMVQLLDLEPRSAAAHVAGESLRVDAPPTRAELLRVARRRANRGAGRAVTELRNAVDVVAATRRWDAEHPDGHTIGNFSARRTVFNQPITARRTVPFTSMSLDVVDRVRRGTGSTVNDVVLAITGGALRRYLRRHHALPTSTLLALTPVSERDGRSASGGNHTSGFVTTLATGIADPRDRLAEVTQVTKAVKLRHDYTAAGSLVGLLDIVPPRTGQQLARLAARLRLTATGPLAFQVVVSNVAGPDTPFYCNAALNRPTQSVRSPTWPRSTSPSSAIDASWRSVSSPAPTWSPTSTDCATTSPPRSKRYAHSQRSPDGGSSLITAERLAVTGELASASRPTPWTRPSTRRPGDPCLNPTCPRCHARAPRN